MTKYPEITVKVMREALAGLPDDARMEVYTGYGPPRRVVTLPVINYDDERPCAIVEVQ